MQEQRESRDTKGVLQAREVPEFQQLQTPAPSSHQEEEGEVARVEMHTVIAKKEYFPSFQMLSPLHFPWSQFQSNFNCKENFVISLRGEGLNFEQSCPM